MSWKESSVVNERMSFITRLNAGERMSDLCLHYGISRKTGYKFKERFERLGLIGLGDQSRAPIRNRRLRGPVAELVLELRRKHPTWGPRKLLEVLRGLHPGIPMPGTTAIGSLIDREGLVTPHRRRNRVPAFPDHLTQAAAANEVWCADYKGQFRLGNTSYCYPLTVSDDATRFLIAIDAFERINLEEARISFEEAFTKYGLPKVIRTDNGAPFASCGLLGLTRLSVFWIKQGIRPERIKSGEPQQNGRHERMHRTLKAETTRPAARNLLQQQERFDCFVETYNNVRPHEALGMSTPAKVYKPSGRSFIAKTLDYPLHDDVVKVDRSGHTNIVRGRGGSFFVSGALAGERIGIRELENDTWLLTFAGIDLGVYDAPSHFFQQIDIPVSAPPET